MCGPLVMALSPRGWRAVWYHVGRWAVYVAIGAMAGSVGAWFTNVGLGRWLAFAMATVLVWQAATRSGFGVRVQAPAWLRRSSQLGARSAVQWARRHPAGGGAALGALNGLLPCGLVYGAAAAALGLGGLADAPLFMIGFAVGTTPGLVGGTAAIDRVIGRIPALRRATPLLLALLAILLVVRGLSSQEFHAH